ncbi:helix-turn-helix domain-containing protein [Promicromonospora kroppenstedtii]|uniref:helix-turn-helix domain-containing protein n=1 Tax=Promicromonospora kroppenstedtii TaxID=440482 RepID=UPI0004B83F89|nr:helix-turn-helix domain-containing protein [Promicromonospora kroppenstedtii]
MSTYRKWSDVRPEIVEHLGEEALEKARERTQAYIDGHRLAERRKELGLTQLELAERMGITKSRVSQIERGEVSTFSAVARYVEALGGTIQITAVFGDSTYLLRSTHAA